MRAATRAKPGTICFKSSRRFAIRSPEKFDTPVMFRPGLPRLATNPARTGSETSKKTMGIEAVAFRAAAAAFVVDARITSTLSLTSSWASAGSRSLLPSAKRSTIKKSLPVHIVESKHGPREDLSKRFVVSA